MSKSRGKAQVCTVVSSLALRADALQMTREFGFASAASLKVYDSRVRRPSAGALVTTISSAEAMCSASCGPVTIVWRMEGLAFVSIVRQISTSNILEMQFPLNDRPLADLVIIGVDRLEGIKFGPLLT